MSRLGFILKIMSVKINYIKNTVKKLQLTQYCSARGFNIKNLKNFLNLSEYNYISDLLKTNDLKKNLLTFEISSKKKIVLIPLKNSLKSYEVENLGAELYGRISNEKNTEFNILSQSITIKLDNFLGHFLHGLKLKSYKFKKYKSKDGKKQITIYVSGNKNKNFVKSQSYFKALEEGTFFARDLVSEPGNILHPDEYARRLKSLSKDGLKVNIYNEKVKKTWDARFTWSRTRKC